MDAGRRHISGFASGSRRWIEYSDDHVFADRDMDMDSFRINCGDRVYRDRWQRDNDYFQPS
jgi:hypothetical protein